MRANGLRRTWKKIQVAGSFPERFCGAERTLGRDAILRHGHLQRRPVTADYSQFITATMTDAAGNTSVLSNAVSVPGK
jgi:hypothetical protein